MKIFKTIALSTGLLASILSAHAQTGARSYTTGHFSLEIDGVRCGEVQALAGGDIQGAVVEEAQSNDYYIKKHLGNLVYNDFKIQVGAGMCPQLYAWIQAALDGKSERKSGSIVVADYGVKEPEVREFQNALLTEITFPGGDGSSKDAGYMNLTFQPEVIRIKSGNSGGQSGGVSVKQKAWLTSNFRLSINGLDTTRVNKIEAFTIKQAIISSPVGATREGTIEPGKIEFPNLSITLPDNAADSFRTWFESFVIEGKNADAQEKEGSLVYLDGGKPLIQIDLHNVGIFKGSAQASENNNDRIGRYNAELYVERMAVKFDSGLFAKNTKDRKATRLPASPAKSKQTQ